MERELPNITVTFLIEFKGRFLLISRGSNEKNFPSLWAFPGGKCEIGETIIDTIRREILEETSLEIMDEGKFLNTYFFKKTVGVAFFVRAKSDKVTLAKEIKDYKWINSVEELQNFNCIPGIYNHLVAAIEVLKNNSFDSLEQLRLTPDKYINK